MIKQFNKFVAAAASLALSAGFVTSASAETEVNVLRQPGNGAMAPLFYVVVEEFPKEAAKLGINDVVVNFQDFKVGGDAVPLLIAGRMDILASGTNNLAVLLSKVGDDVKLLTGWGGYDYKLVCTDPAIKTVADIKPTTPIAMKGMNGGEHFFMKSIGKVEFDSYEYFDQNITLLPRPQIQQLMEAGDKNIVCGVPGTPAQDALIRSGKAHLVYQSDGINTVGISLSSMAMEKWLEENPVLAEAWVNAVNVAVEKFNNDPRTYLAQWIEKDGMKFDLENLVQNRADGNVHYTLKPTNVVPYLNLLIDTGVIDAPKQTLEGLAWRADLLQ